MSEVKLISAEEEYAKTKSLRKEDVLALREWTGKQPHLPKMSEVEVIFFLQSCYYSIETAKNVIDTFYTVRTHCPEFFKKRNPQLPEIMRDFDVCLFATLPKLTPDGNRIIFTRLIDCDANRYVFTDQLRAFDMSTMLALHQTGTAEGQIILSDMQGVTFAHVTKLGLLPMKKFMFYLQEAMPVRLKGLHFINVVPFMDKILALMKPFMKKELADVLHLHSDPMDSLYKFVPKECLPKDYGGTMDSVENLHADMKRNILAHAQYFIDEEKQVVDESQRPGKPKNAGELFGVEGTFKKLDID